MVSFIQSRTNIACGFCSSFTHVCIPIRNASGLIELRGILEAADKAASLGPLDDNLEDEEEESNEEEEEEGNVDYSDLSNLLARVGIA